MTYRLAIGDRNYSSWSLRSWLLFAQFGIAHYTLRLHLDSPGFAAELAPFAPARTVPALRLPDDTLVHDTYAIAETLAERHPDLPLWPTAPGDRARARVLAAEMHSSFAALRSDCPMNLRRAYRGFTPSEAVLRDLSRVEALWDHAGFGGAHTPGWLFGEFGIVDAFYAPVAARIATYDLPVGKSAQAYVARHLATPAFRRWRATGLLEASVHVDCDLALPKRPWPGPTPLPARAVTGMTPINTTCPFSGKPVQPDSLTEITGTVIGFCNTFCRDKVTLDPAAWPEVTALLGTS